MGIFQLIRMHGELSHKSFLLDYKLKPNLKSKHIIHHWVASQPQHNILAFSKLSSSLQKSKNLLIVVVELLKLINYK